ncbi:MAG: type II toxin-antitoxin system VapC family toxin [Gaiellaceae bacterium]
MSAILVCDTGVVFAALDTTDSDHASCRGLLGSGESLVTLPAPVIVEVGWLTRSRGRPHALDLLLGSVEDGSVLVVNLDSEDYRRVRSLIRTYSDLPLDLVDAAVIAIAERLEQTTVATLDRRHFSVVRPAHAPAFELVP